MNRGLSIIICCFNSAHRLLPTLTAISQQQIHDSILWELLIIDNASTDDTANRADAILNQLSFSAPYRIVKENQPGLIHARKRAIRESGFEFLLFCDDDNWLDEHYAQNAYEIMSADPAIGVLGGWGIPEYECQPPEWFVKMGLQYATGKQAARNGEVPFSLSYVYGAGSVYRKSIFSLLDTFDAKYYLTGRKGNQLLGSEDVELGYLITLLKYTIWFSDSLTFKHFIESKRLTWKYAMSNSYGHGYSRAFLRPYQRILFDYRYNFISEIAGLSKDIFSLIKNLFKPISRRHCILNLCMRLGEINAYLKFRKSLLEQTNVLTSFNSLVQEYHVNNRK